jgi:low affinity Fe/Cu permease
VGVHDRAVFRYRLGDHGADTWQLVINTATTIITFLMVFLIQATQNRDSKAIQLNLDELLRAITKARTGLVGLEHLPESEIQELEAEFATLKGDVADELSTAQRYPIPENAGANRDE